MNTSFLGVFLIEILGDKALGKSDICGALCESELGKCTPMNRNILGEHPSDPSRMLQAMPAAPKNLDQHMSHYYNENTE